MGLFIWKIEAIFQLFLLINIRCTILLSCGIAQSTHLGNNIIQLFLQCSFMFVEQTKETGNSIVQLFLQCSFMFVEQTKETVNWKWNMALLADLNWSRGQHVLFSNILCCFCYICVCAQIIIILIFSLSTDIPVTIFQISNIDINAINNQP